MIKTVKIKEGDWVEVNHPCNGGAVVWGYVLADPQPNGYDPDTFKVIMVRASFDARFPVDQKVRFNTACMTKVAVI